MRFVRIFLGILIVIGILLLGTQKWWVPPLTDFILQEEAPPVPVLDSEHVVGTFYGAYVQSILASTSPNYDQRGYVTAQFVQSQEKVRASGKPGSDPVLCAKGLPPPIHFLKGSDTATSSSVGAYWVSTSTAMVTRMVINVGLIKQGKYWLINSISCMPL